MKRLTVLALALMSVGLASSAVSKKDNPGNDENDVLSEYLAEANLEIGNDTQMIGLLLREMSHIIRTAVEEEGRIAAFDDEVSEYGFWGGLWQGVQAFAHWVYDNAEVLLKVAVNILELIVKLKSGMYGLEDNGSTAPAGCLAPPV
ncbi:uncharacterized protein ISCGN_017696 [Ixodes scapularis]